MTETQPHFPFHPRPGTRHPESEPNHSLNQIQKQEISTLPEPLLKQALQFEENLTRSPNLTPDSPEPTPGFEIPWSTKIQTAVFYPEYFCTNQGQQELATLFDPETLPACLTTPHSNPTPEIIDQITLFLSYQDYSQIDNKDLKELEGNSFSYIQEKFVDMFTANQFEFFKNTPLPQRFSINLNPEETLFKLKQYRQLKNFHRQLARDLKTQDTPLARAKYALLQIHRHRLNQFILSGYVTAQAIIAQSDRVQKSDATTETKNKWQHYQEKAVDYTQAPLTFSTDQSKQRNFSRFDKLKHGAGLTYEQLADQIDSRLGIKITNATTHPHDFSPISQELLDLIFESTKPAPKPSMYRYQNLDSETLSSIQINFEDLKGLFETALSRHHPPLLSQDTNYDPKRKGRASDGLIQVVANPTKDSSSYNNRQGVIKLSPHYNENIASTTNLIAHEGWHVSQNLLQPQLIPLALAEKIGIKSADILEAGATQTGIKTETSLFGTPPRPPNTEYLLATLTKLAGGNFLDCMKVWFDQHLKRFPNEDKTEAAKDAFDRTIRLFRSGGKISADLPFATNTKDLVYSERHLVILQLEQLGLEFLTHLGLDSQTFLLLESAGFIDRSVFQIPPQNFTQIIIDKIDNIVGYKPDNKI